MKGLITGNGGVQRTKGAFGDVEYMQWKKVKDGMQNIRGKKLPLMRFPGRRLRSRKGMLEGSLESG